jgi:hypothetical protein
MSIQYQALLISAAAAIGAIVILDYYHQDESPYYGDGGKATYICALPVERCSSQIVQGDYRLEKK